MEEIKRYQAVAQVLLQICVTILPIGAGATSFIAQQGETMANLLAVISVLIGLMLISVSAFRNLEVLKFDRGNALEQEAVKGKFLQSINIFVLGTAFIVISPVGFAVSQLLAAGPVEMDLSSETLSISHPDASPIERNIVLTIRNLRPEQVASIKMQTVALNDECISVTRADEMLPASRKEDWVTLWKITLEPLCPLGDEIVQFKVLRYGKVMAETALIVRINEK